MMFNSTGGPFQKYQGRVTEFTDNIRATENILSMHQEITDGDYNDGHPFF